jgi:hypothetical protein
MKKLLAALGGLLGFVVVAPGTSTAGGWVVVSLDSAPAFDAGARVDVGFTVLRHGVTPESSNDITIVLTDRDGEQYRFAAVPEGAKGHHVVTIDVPDVESFTWKALGEFVDVDLGTVTLGAGERDGGSSWGWDVLQWGSGSLAVALGGLAGFDVLRSRRLARSAAAT